MTFFSNPDLTDNNRFQTFVTNDLYDEQGSAHFFTEILFKNKNLSSLFQENHEREGIRSKGVSLLGPSSNASKDNFSYKQGRNQIPLPNVSFVETGELVGIKSDRDLVVPLLNGTNNNLYTGEGGGILGTRSYLKRSNLSGPMRDDYDGADKMNRVWAKTLLSDFLCKELPAIRYEDGQAFVSQQADSSFRKSQSCISCHVSMDQLAAAGRGIRNTTLTLGASTRTNPNFFYNYHLPVTQIDADLWPLNKDPNYSQRPAKGKLFYRSYDGELINRDFNNFDELGKILSTSKDFYACVARRYFKHFTGVDVSLMDLEINKNSKKLTPIDKNYLKQVIKLGENLQTHQSLKKLIEEIINSEIYKTSNYLPEE